MKSVCISSVESWRIKMPSLSAIAHFRDSIFTIHCRSGNPEFLNYNMKPTMPSLFAIAQFRDGIFTIHYRSRNPEFLNDKKKPKMPSLSVIAQFIDGIFTNLLAVGPLKFRNQQQRKTLLYTPVKQG